MMDILMSETCWAHKKWNKIPSDIKLVFHSSTITMMHGPINIRPTFLTKGVLHCYIVMIPFIKYSGKMILATKHSQNISPWAVLYFLVMAGFSSTAAVWRRTKCCCSDAAVVIMSASDTSELVGWTDASPTAAAVTAAPFWLPCSNWQLTLRANADTCTPVLMYTCHDRTIRYSAQVSTYVKAELLGKRRQKVTTRLDDVWWQTSFGVGMRGTEKYCRLSKLVDFAVIGVRLETITLLSALTLWRRNYFFNFSTPCIQNVNNTGTEQVSIMKQTAFWREKKKRRV